MELDVTPRLREVLSTKIDSFEKLELLVALHGEPHATSTIDRMSERLGYSRHAIRDAAVQLSGVSILAVSSTGELQLLPPTDRDREALAELIDVYQNDRVAVIKALGEVALGKIRSMASTVFADAFVIRRKKDGRDG